MCWPSLLLHATHSFLGERTGTHFYPGPQGTESPIFQTREVKTWSCFCDIWMCCCFYSAPWFAKEKSKGCAYGWTDLRSMLLRSMDAPKESPCTSASTLGRVMAQSKLGNTIGTNNSEPLGVRHLYPYFTCANYNVGQSDTDVASEPRIPAHSCVCIPYHDREESQRLEKCKLALQCFCLGGPLSLWDKSYSSAQRQRDRDTLMCEEEKGKEMILANIKVYLKTWGPFVFINHSVIIEINSLLCCNASYVIKNSMCVGVRAHIC